MSQGHRRTRVVVICGLALLALVLLIGQFWLMSALRFTSGQSSRLFKDGSQARDQVYVDDVVNCTLAAAGLANAGGHLPNPISGVYNVGSGVATSFREIAEAISSVPSCAGFKVEYFDMPEHIRAFYQDFTCADISATTTGLGWRPVWNTRQAVARYAALLCEDPTL